MKSEIPDIRDIQRAAERIRPFIHKTPVLTSDSINRMSGARILFKCENFQKTGVFKFRGACNAVFSLTDEEASNGVVTHSSGNHAQALSLAARMRGIPARIVMPSNSSRVKIEAVKEYGAELTFCEPTQQARETTSRNIAARTGARFIHSYNDPDVISGQGTVVLELLEQINGVDTIIAPVGGGGLLSGVAIAVKNLSPDIRVIGAEPETADDAYRSFQSGKLVKPDSAETIADGLRTSLGTLTFSAILKYVDDIVTVPEDSISHAMRTVWERMKIVIEPSSAVPVATLFKKRPTALSGQPPSGKELSTIESNSALPDRKICLILTGGNVDLDHLPWL